MENYNYTTEETVKHIMTIISCLDDEGFFDLWETPEELVKWVEEKNLHPDILVCLSTCLIGKHGAFFSSINDMKKALESASPDLNHVYLILETYDWGKEGNILTIPVRVGKEPFYIH